MVTLDWHVVALTLGLVLASALLAGRLALTLRMPKVTLYLLVGLLLGPSILHLIDHEQLDTLQPLGQLAMALVLFSMGCHFPLRHFRRVLPRVMRLSAGELSLTFLLVAFGLILLGTRWQASLLFGALALATAPATTMLVLRENESEGPITEFTTALVAINNLAAIVLFELLFLSIRLFEGQLDDPVPVQLGQFAIDLLGATSLGVIGGLAISFACALSASSVWLVALIAVSTILLGTCEVLQIPYLLTFLAMGVTVANTSDLTRQIVAELDRVTVLLCVVFFVIHGAEMDLQALYRAGWLGVAYVALRSLGKYFGIYLAARKEEAEVRLWLGAGLLSQAGAAIALSAIAARRYPEVGGEVQAVILGTVVVFEIAGPMLVRQAVFRAGEVPISRALRHRTTTFGAELQQLWNRLRMALGYAPWANRGPEELTVRHMMRKDVESVPGAATFDQVVSHIERSRDDLYPVVGPDGELTGVIHYPSLRNALFDPDLGALVRAEDLALPALLTLHPDDPLDRAWQVIDASQADCVPVVSREAPHQLVGIIKRRDILGLVARGNPALNGNK